MGEIPCNTIKIRFVCWDHIVSFSWNVKETITRLIPCVGADGAFDSAADMHMICDLDRE